MRDSIEDALLAEPQTTTEAVHCERMAVVFYLRQWAKENRRRASALLADTMQNRPEAELLERDALRLTQAADGIAKGDHWR